MRTNQPERSSETIAFGDEKIEVFFRKVKKPGDLGTFVTMNGAPKPEFKPGSTILPKGATFIANGKSLSCDILQERDIPIKLRDSVTIYTDIYRPVNGVKVPAIISWSPYGKQVPQNASNGVPQEAVSGLQKFEGPDPAYWCNHGYAVINIDARGAYFSEGDIRYWGTAEANDVYDVVEWLAVQEWCNGKVAMSGNSWLGIIQWFAASKHPPHLAAIAPWEGHIDLYRYDVLRGGIPDTGFNDLVTSLLAGKNRVEDMSAMAEKYPLMNAYWEDKSANLEEITIPAYVVASYYTHHTIDGFRRISSKDKWLRVHNTHEWSDYYTPENVEDLRLFFDRYLKGNKNGWEKTSRVRLSIIDAGGTDSVNRHENEWPLARTQYQKLYLNGEAGTLSLEQPEKESFVRYKTDDGKGKAIFIYKVSKKTELTGYIKLHLWVEAEGSDDIDIFTLIQKLDPQGKPLVTPYDYMGPDGRMRASHRQLDARRSTSWLPYHTHRFEELLKPGQIVSVDIEIRPTGMLLHANQQLRITIAGFNPYSSRELSHLGMPGPQTRNKGFHVIHTGEKYDSYLQIPFIPE